MKMRQGGYFLMLLALAIMTLHSVVPHHHHDPEDSSHQHEATGHSHDHEKTDPLPLSHAEHADFTISMASRISLPDLVLTVPDLTFIDLYHVIAFINHEITWSGKSPPEPRIVSLFYYTFSGLRAPPVSLFA